MKASVIAVLLLALYAHGIPLNITWYPNTKGLYQYNAFNWQSEKNPLLRKNVFEGSTYVPMLYTNLTNWETDSPVRLYVLRYLADAPVRKGSVFVIGDVVVVSSFASLTK
jgi:hypothetical protein